MFVARLDGRPIAAATTYAGHGRLAYSMPRYDPEFRRFSPGHVVLREIVRHAAAAGLDVDMLLGAYEYKEQWANDQYETLTVRAGSSTVTLRAGRSLTAATDRARSLVTAARGRVRAGSR